MDKLVTMSQNEIAEIQAKLKRFKAERDDETTTLARHLEIERETDAILDRLADELAAQIVAHRNKTVGAGAKIENQNKAKVKTKTVNQVTEAA